MITKLKLFLRNILPAKIQVPFKYYFNIFTDNYELEFKYLKYLINENDLVIDVGANRGFYSYAFWKLGAMIESFEPNPLCFNILNKWSNNKANINIHCVALSDDNNSSVLNIPIDEFGVIHDASASIIKKNNENCISQNIECRKLDNYLFTNISFIKIDVEGYENKVLDGSILSINKSNPVILIEIEQRHISNDINFIFNKLIDLKYNGFFIFKDNIFPIKDFSVCTHQKLSNLNNKNNNYVNNFIFLSKIKLQNGDYHRFFEAFKK